MYKAVKIRNPTAKKIKRILRNPKKVLNYVILVQKIYLIIFLRHYGKKIK